jgi:heptosyltransferase-3
MYNDPKSIQNILVIKLRAIGDVLLSTIVLNNLREYFPASRIDFLTERASREVVDGHPALNSFILFDPRCESGLQLILKVRRRKYDLVIDLFGNPRSALVTLLSGAPHRVGYRLGWRRYCYNTVVEPRGGSVHNAEFNLDALRAIGVPITNRSVVFPVDAESERFAETFFRTEGIDTSPVVALNPGGGWYTKRWRVPQYGRLADLLARQFQVVPLIMWGPAEQADAERIREITSCGARVAPQTNLKQLAAILKRCAAIVTNDSGPMHIAASLGVPVVAIFGPTNPMLQGPLGSQHEIVRKEDLDCLGCNYTDCPIGNPCMENLDEHIVLSAFGRLAERMKLLNAQSVSVR